MGCDIHMYKEKKINGEWVTADEWEDCTYMKGSKSVPYEKSFNDRNYRLFGLLSDDVRGYSYPFSLKPRGIPYNACYEVKMSESEWDSGGHSHSYIHLSELKELNETIKKEKIEVKGQKEKSSLKLLLQNLRTEHPNYDLLFPFCGWTTQEGYEDFSIMVPAEYMIGKGLEKIISSFDGIDGEDHRIVFWFDN